ncbi:MAG: MFS transporter [Candidatus Thorarchaeota archaeon]
MGRMASFFGFKEDNVRVLRIARTFLTLIPILVATVVMSSTFYMIFIADALGGGPGRFLEGLGLVGVLVIIQLAFQTLLDYPTGAVGDWIGQRWVIASSYMCYALSFYLTSLITPSTPFPYFVLVYILVAVAASQESGAWGAWFDNNYRVAVPDDDDRKAYGVFLGRSGMIFQIVATAALIPGSVLALVFGRAWVFQLEAILCFVLSLLILRLVVDFPEISESRQRPTMSEYTGLLKSGVSFLFSNPFVKWFIIGGTLVTSAIIVWGNLLLFPFYFLYLITDVGVASFRTILFFPGIISEERSGVWSKRFEQTKWIPRFRLLQTCGFVFFGMLALFMFVFPPVTEGVIMMQLLIPFTNIVFLELPQIYIGPIFLLFLVFVITGLMSRFAMILSQRLLLDVIPNKIRNSVYSLIPTVAMILALPQIVIVGFVIQYLGFPVALMMCGLVSFIGVLMIRKGLSYPVPTPEEETWGSQKEEPPIDLEELTDIEIDVDDDMI